MKTLVRQLDEIFEKEPDEDAMMQKKLEMMGEKHDQVSTTTDENEIPF